MPKKLNELDEVFYLCSNLETVNIPAGATLKTIKSQALKTNTKLKAFNFLGECALTEIQDNAFVGLKDLKTFNFPKSVTAIGTNAFGGCHSLETVSFDKDAEIVAIGSGAFADCGLKNFNVPKKVSKIEREPSVTVRHYLRLTLPRPQPKLAPRHLSIARTLPTSM